MERKDKKTLKTIYKEFVETSRNYDIETKRVAERLKKSLPEIHRSVDRLIHMKLVEIQGRRKDTCFISLTEKGITEADKMNQKFYEKVDWIKGVSFVVTYFLGLFTPEIKSLISGIVEAISK